MHFPFLRQLVSGFAFLAFLSISACRSWRSISRHHSRGGGNPSPARIFLTVGPLFNLLLMQRLPCHAQKQKLDYIPRSISMPDALTRRAVDERLQHLPGHPRFGGQVQDPAEQFGRRVAPLDRDDVLIRAFQDDDEVAGRDGRLASPPAERRLLISASPLWLIFVLRFDFTDFDHPQPEPAEQVFQAPPQSAFLLVGLAPQHGQRL